MLLAIETFVGQLALLVGAMGLAGIFSPLTKPHVPVLLPAVVFTLPFLLVYTLTFFRRPLVTGRPFRRLWLFAACWYGFFAIAVEVCCFLDLMPPESPAYAFTLCRVLMHVGWLSFVPLIHTFITESRAHGTTPAA
ncbi:MAG: hypothetical protein ACRC1K_12710 [Planctomycetia bacterium]